MRESGSARDSWGGVRVRQSGRDWERDSGIDRKKFKKEKSWRGSLKLNKKDKQTVGGEEKTLAMVFFSLLFFSLLLFSLLLLLISLLLLLLLFIVI